MVGHMTITMMIIITVLYNRLLSAMRIFCQNKSGFKNNCCPINISIYYKGSQNNSCKILISMYFQTVYFYKEVYFSWCIQNSRWKSAKSFLTFPQTYSLTWIQISLRQFSAFCQKFYMDQEKITPTVSRCK